jgi:hypothetical protein
MSVIVLRPRPIGPRGWLCAIVLGAWLASPLAGTDAAVAQAVGTAPWCVDMGVLGYGYLECQYFTYAQCAERARGITNVCQLNPWYVPKGPQARRQRRDRRQ